MKSRGEALRVIAGASSGGALFVVRPEAAITSPTDPPSPPAPSATASESAPTAASVRQFCSSNASSRAIAASGIAIRLYSPEDFAGRPEFTEPEILRTNLASVILQMTALGLGDLAAFPFVEPPDRRNVKDGVDLLVELGALDPAAEDATSGG